MVTTEQFREIAMSWPETEERETWGHPTFRVRAKIFATLAADGKSARIKATLETQDALLALHPETFSVADYTGRFGWVTARLATADPAQIRALLGEAWRRTAPASLVRRYDDA